MSFSAIRLITCALIFPAMMISPLGCAKRNLQHDTLKEYRKMLERQKSANAREEQKALAKIPEMTAEGHERLGDQYLSQGNIPAAFIQYDKALRLEPNQSRIRYKIGRLYLEKGLLEEAKKEFEEILKADPKHGLSHEGMGRVYLKMGNPEGAKKSFLRATQLDSQLWQSHHFLGIIDARERKFDAAIAHYKTAISINPNDASLFNNLGMSLFLKGDYERAIKAFSEAIRIDHSNKKTYNNLALALHKLQRDEEAFEAFKKGGDEATAYYNLGCLYAMEENYHKAIKAFEKAIELKPGFYAQADENLKKARAAINRK